MPTVDTSNLATTTYVDGKNATQDTAINNLKTADQTLQSNINTVNTDSVNRDNALQGQINGLNTTVSQNKATADAQNVTTNTRIDNINNTVNRSYFVYHTF